jgi:hypothetical protein
MDIGFIGIVIVVISNAVIVGIAYGVMRTKLNAIPNLLTSLKTEIKAYIQGELRQMEKMIENRIDKVEKDVARHDVIIERELKDAG